MSVKHLNQRQLAERWNVAEATLERWRSARQRQATAWCHDALDLLTPPEESAAVAALYTVQNVAAPGKEPSIALSNPR